jgi:hypothetical protein
MTSAVAKSTYLLSPSIPDPDYDSGKDSDSRESDPKEEEDSSTAWDSDGGGKAGPVSLRRGSDPPRDASHRHIWQGEGTGRRHEDDLEERGGRYDSDRRSSEKEERTEKRRTRRAGLEVGDERGEARRRPVKEQERRESTSSGASRYCRTPKHSQVSP